MLKYFLTTILLVLLPGIAIAATNEALTTNWALGIAMSTVWALVSAYVALSNREANRRFEELTRRLNEHGSEIGQLYSRTNDLRSEMQVNHHPKSEIRELLMAMRAAVMAEVAVQMSPVVRKIDAVHMRMDLQGYPQSRDTHHKE